MKKYSFKNDYSESAHPNILNCIANTNMQQNEGYGEDDFCEKAKAILKKHMQRENVDIYFMTGGTIVNLTAISSFLKPYEAVICSDIGHVNTHETGAIEYTGHKVISVKSVDGKLYKTQIQQILDEHTDHHMVKPKLVYISNSTENGLIYKKDELINLRNICDENNLLLYMDGARLGSALCSKYNDVTISEISNLVDAFYLGATKNGALFGEALIICNDSLKENFKYSIKQKGAMLSKGWLLGIQFYELFKDGLYYDLANHANSMAQILADGLKKLGIEFLSTPQTNQIFPIFTNDMAGKLDEKYEFYFNYKVDDNKSAYRLVTSWATDLDKVNEFLEYFTKMINKKTIV